MVAFDEVGTTSTKYPNYDTSYGIAVDSDSTDGTIVYSGKINDSVTN
jgi:hypothetical protein